MTYAEQDGEGDIAELLVLNVAGNPIGTFRARVDGSISQVQQILSQQFGSHVDLVLNSTVLPASEPLSALGVAAGSRTAVTAVLLEDPLHGAWRPTREDEWTRPDDARDPRTREVWTRGGACFWQHAEHQGGGLAVSGPRREAQGLVYDVIFSSRRGTTLVLADGSRFSVLGDGAVQYFVRADREDSLAGLWRPVRSEDWSLPHQATDERTNERWNEWSFCTWVTGELDTHICGLGVVTSPPRTTEEGIVWDVDYGGGNQGRTTLLRDGTRCNFLNGGNNIEYFARTSEQGKELEGKWCTSESGLLEIWTAHGSCVRLGGGGRTASVSMLSSKAQESASGTVYSVIFGTVDGMNHAGTTMLHPGGNQRSNAIEMQMPLDDGSDPPGKSVITEHLERVA